MISVIMPVYNGEKFVAQALQSVQAQTVSDWELVAVNDGSQDGTQGILEGFARGDGRIRLLSQPNGGVSAARNTAMAAARGTEARLATLESLNKQGLLTPEEYEAKRAEILGEL